MSDETAPNEEKRDFQSLRERFECAELRNKRPSLPNAKTPPPVPPKPTTLRRSSQFKLSTPPPVSPKPRFTSPEASPSPGENDVGKSVSEIRQEFEKEKKMHFYQHRTNPTKVKIPSLDLPDLPSRPPPQPAHFIPSQLHEYFSIRSSEPIDSATADSSLSSNPILSRSNSSDGSFTDEEEIHENEQRAKFRKCVEEVYHTEKTYVGILYVLSVKLSAEVKNTCEKEEHLIVLFNNTYRQLLGSIQSLYRLHHETILPQFEKYITGHETGNIWTVIEKNLKFIEIIYKDYYVKYYGAQEKLDEICRENPLLNEAMMKCQSYLDNLYPLTQLNCANQRLLRYILCMKTYMKYLNEDSDEYRQTRSIHDQLDQIAMRCQEELVISPAQLNELNERLDNRFECFKSQRRLLWHGLLKKQSPRRRNDIVQRYVILFSDCMLVCSEEFGKKLEIKRELSMKDLTLDVLEGGKTWTLNNANDSNNSSIVYYPFRVNAVEKSYELLTDKEIDRDLWIRKIRQASEDYNKKATNIEIRHSFSQTEDRQQLGKRAPIWVNDNDVSRCQICNTRFPNGVLSRRHHCRSCGRCICGSCSSKRSILEYCRDQGEMRVCDTCYTHFTGIILSKNFASWPKVTRDVDQTILFGDFRPINSNTSVWIALQEDYQLHVFAAKLDQAEDYAIKVPELIEIHFDSVSRTFTWNESTKKHAFILDVNHQLTWNRTEQTEERMKAFDNKLLFYADLWLDAIRCAHTRTLPNWYVRKRDSADSGVNVG